MQGLSLALVEVTIQVDIKDCKKNRPKGLMMWPPFQHGARGLIKGFSQRNTVFATPGTYLSFSNSVDLLLQLDKQSRYCLQDSSHRDAATKLPLFIATCETDKSVRTGKHMNCTVKIPRNSRNCMSHASF